MSLLGELHKIECYSCSWDQESASEKETKQRDLPLTIEVQEPPLYSKPLLWMEPRLYRNEDLFPSTNPTCNPTSHHFDTCTSSASPGKASNSTLGSRHHEKYINAGSGKALNSNDILVCHNDELPLQRLAKHHRAEGHRLNGTSLHGRFEGSNDHPKIWPPNMMSIILSIVKSYSFHPECPLFYFEMNSEAAEKIFMVLKSFNFKIGRAIEAQAKSPVGYGLEFRKGGILFPLLRNHPLWPRMKDLLKFGSRWPTEPIPKKDRSQTLTKPSSLGITKAPRPNQSFS
jgi:hypothetical protein